MAIARDTYLAMSDNTGTTVTKSYTVSGANRLLLVFIHSWVGDNVSGVTYNGVAMTQTLKQNEAPATNYNGYIYSLIAPATGTNNIVVSGTSMNFSMGAISYTGVAQTGFPDATAVAKSQVANVTGTITTVADNAGIVGLFSNDNSMLAAVTNMSIVTGTGLIAAIFESSSFPLTPAGSYSITGNHSGGSWNGMVIVSFAPAVAAPATGNFPFEAVHSLDWLVAKFQPPWGII